MFNRQLRCSFCGKGASEVAKLVAGRRAYICDACVAAAKRIMDASPDDPATAVLSTAAPDDPGPAKNDPTTRLTTTSLAAAVLAVPVEGR